MTAGHLVAYADLALLGDAYLGHLHDARGKVVTVGDVVLLTVKLALNLLGLAHIVSHKLSDHLVDAGIISPVAQYHCLIVEAVEIHVIKTSAALHYLYAEEILHAARNKPLGQRVHLLNENIANFALASLKFFLDLLKHRIRCLAAGLALVGA